MPTYNFIDTETDEEFEVVMKIAERHVQTRRVDESNLQIRSIDETGDAMSGRLRTRRDDRKLLTDERVEQRGLADVRSSHERYESATVGHGRRASEKQGGGI